MEILIWQAAVASTVLVASRFHRRGHIYVALAWTLFTITAVYASWLVLLQLFVAWGAVALVQARRRNAQDPNPLESVLQTGTSLGDSTDVKSGATWSKAPAANRLLSSGNTASLNQREGTSSSALPGTKKPSQSAQGRRSPTTAARPTPIWYPSFKEAAAHAKKLSGAVIKPDGAGFRLDVDSKDQRGATRTPSIAKTSGVDPNQTFSSPQGRFEIRRSDEHNGRWDLLYKGQWLGFYRSPFAAADAVYRQSTRSPEWDSAPWTDVMSETSGWDLLAR